MGTMLVARCECGYMHGPIMQGGGFADFTTHDMEPAYCERCREMVVLNYMAQRPTVSDVRGQTGILQRPIAAEIAGGRKTAALRQPVGRFRPPRYG